MEGDNEFSQARSEPPCTNMGGATACPRPAPQARRGGHLGRGQAVAPPIFAGCLIADLGRYYSLSGGAATLESDPLPINRETTKNLTDLGC